MYALLNAISSPVLTTTKKVFSVPSAWTTATTAQIVLIVMYAQMATTVSATMERTPVFRLAYHMKVSMEMRLVESVKSAVKIVFNVPLMESACNVRPTLTSLRAANVSCSFDYQISTLP